ncbi:recombination mediator RecR [Sulfuriroseicoccus oceanibius]|uniref:Recombination protein RecR n=1 Tax=Sulfuriroseicoccus oceanibius TaxID=2707525 RepID=A0A6B3LB13_9BACT|nr:recombination mediator RecR [Sulfuriroseicoccus oceanibius]QQL44019.1 recombination protein RecR [Sulfuriroseicoccus oceanibius]
MAIDFPDSVRELVTRLKKLPGVGPRSAERIAVWLINQRSGEAGLLSGALAKVDQAVSLCRRCGFFMDEGACAACAAADRDRTVMCVVAQPTDVLSIERTGQFKGRYHVLGGTLSPLDNVTPEDLNIDELCRRCGEGSDVTEVVLALGSDVEGEATSHYLVERLVRDGLQVTRLAHGLPAGGGIDHADPLTLMRAFTDRRSV